MTADNDSNDLEALFDSIAADYSVVKPAEPAPAVAAKPIPEVGDNDELQALFDSVSAKVEEAVPEGGDNASWDSQEAVFNKIGQMARTLHDTLSQLGYDKLLEKTVSALPDAKDRLAYVANLTEQAACRVLNATDIANPLVAAMESDAQGLAARWDKAFANQLTTPDFKQL
ncbi:MAG: protein phosphatase CheZ, partial [Azovibrio sp.]|nr:protein phosphatase CheZ [Azovibrio sp.]